MALRLKKVKNVVFDEFTHTYICGDKILIGVTSLMKKHGLSPDYGGISEEVLAKAAARGTAIHNMLEKYDNGESVIDDEQGNLKAYRELGLRIDRSEYLVTDGKNVASFIDKVYEDGSLGDVKTTATLHKRSVSWQLSIYAYLFEKQNPKIKVPHIYAIHVRDGKAVQVELPRIPNEEVEKLFAVEEAGMIYSDTIPAPEVSATLQDAEVLTLVESLDLVAQYKAAIKAEEEKCEAIMKKLYEYMTENNLDEMACESGTFVRKAEYTRTSLDSAKIKKDMPEVYEKYSKTTTVAGTISYKLNK